MTLVGALGGFFGAEFQTPQYTATAFVVVYRMPAGQSGLISPDQANTLQSTYEAGVFQDQIIARALPFFPGLTAADFRRSVKIAIVAYSPYTRVIVTRPDPRQAVALANNVSDNWAQLTQNLYEEEFHALRQRLLVHISDMNNQVDALQASVTAQKARQPQNPAVIQALQSQVTAAQQQTMNLAQALNAMTTYHDEGENLAYTAVRADIHNVSKQPDTLKVIVVGMGIGMITSILFALWGMRIWGWVWPREFIPDGPDLAIPAEGWG